MSWNDIKKLILGFRLPLLSWPKVSVAMFLALAALVWWWRSEPVSTALPTPNGGSSPAIVPAAQKDDGKEVDAPNSEVPTDAMVMKAILSASELMSGDAWECSTDTFVEQALSQISGHKKVRYPHDVVMAMIRCAAVIWIAEKDIGEPYLEVYINIAKWLSDNPSTAGYHARYVDAYRCASVAILARSHLSTVIDSGVVKLMQTEMTWMRKSVLLRDAATCAKSMDPKEHMDGSVLMAWVYAANEWLLTYASKADVTEGPLQSKDRQLVLQWGQDILDRSEHFEINSKEGIAYSRDGSIFRRSPPLHPGLPLLRLLKCQLKIAKSKSPPSQGDGEIEKEIEEALREAMQALLSEVKSDIHGGKQRLWWEYEKDYNEYNLTYALRAARLTYYVIRHRLQRGESPIGQDFAASVNSFAARLGYAVTILGDERHYYRTANPEPRAKAYFQAEESDFKAQSEGRQGVAVKNLTQIADGTEAVPPRESAFRVSYTPMYLGIIDAERAILRHILVNFKQAMTPASGGGK
jgi:hypothetical protein